MTEQRSQSWHQIVGQVTAEYSRLPQLEKDWIAARLKSLGELQGRLNQLFEKGDGLSACGACSGECCAKGHNHMTLANLLCFLQQDEPPPASDFSRTCPFLTEQGCSLPVARRPYNCISFVCDIIEKSLTSAELAEFYSLDQQLRGIYQEFAGRYTGAGMTGLLLQQNRLAGRAFLARKTTAGSVSGSTGA